MNIKAGEATGKSFAKHRYDPSHNFPQWSDKHSPNHQTPMFFLWFLQNRMQTETLLCVYFETEVN